MEELDVSSKVELRRHFRQQRMSVTREDHQEWSAAIARRVIALPEFCDARVILSYLSRNNEVATNLIIEAALSAGKLVLTPSPDIRALPADGLHYVTAMSDDHSAKTDCYCGDASLEKLDLIIVPGIVWDHNGQRIGFGGGYFDRLLAGKNTHCLAVGLAYEMQLVYRIPADPWDIPVDLVVTETSIYRAP